jgi:hypothetical protein
VPVLRELSLGLLKLDLKRARIDLREKISLVDELAFLEKDSGELAINAASNGNRVEGGNRPKSIEINGQIALLRRSNHHRHDQGARAEVSFALAGSRCGPSRVRCLARILCAVVIPAAQSYNAKYDNPEPPTALRRRGGRHAARAWLGKV